jgi:hypothetical protein
LLGKSFDHVVLCEIEQGIDRQSGEVTQLLRSGIGAADRAQRIEEILDWDSAVDFAWSTLGIGEMLVIQACTVSKTVRKVQLMLGLEQVEAGVV